MPENENIITFNNASVLAWLSENGITGKHYDYITPQDILHRDVYGHIPYWLAAYANTVNEVSIPRLDRKDRDRFRRGKLTVQEMDHAGAHIASYSVRLQPK